MAGVSDGAGGGKPAPAKTASKGGRGKLLLLAAVALLLLIGGGAGGAWYFGLLPIPGLPAPSGAASA
ncbi:hypothetical protein, partial [Teichococcus cervicalis]|uniref:hypothetical protein n=1 Tax=Teichococcus cervicalis TaxID=204525 RepID=UPI0005902CF7